MPNFRVPGCTCFIAGDDLDPGTVGRQRSWAPSSPDRLPQRRSTADVGPDPEIEALALGSTARRAAYALRKAHPQVVFTSGRRDKTEQARAMADNIVRNRKWIEETYARCTVRTHCQQWLDEHPDASSRFEIAAGLLRVLESSTDAQLGLFSKHLSGDAFDVLPAEADAEAIKATIRHLPGLGRFLDEEGGVVRWHAQF